MNTFNELIDGLFIFALTFGVSFFISRVIMPIVFTYKDLFDDPE